MDRIEAMTLLSEIKHYLTAGNPVWDVDEIAEALDMAIEALRNEINCVKCVHYTERETYTGIKGVCKMDTAHCDKDAISREGLLKSWEELSPRGRTEFDQVIMTIPELPSAEPKTGEWIPVSDIRKLEAVVYMHIDSLEGTRNIVEAGMLSAWKEVAEYVDGMLGEDGEA